MAPSLPPVASRWNDLEPLAQIGHWRAVVVADPLAQHEAPGGTGPERLARRPTFGHGTRSILAAGRAMPDHIVPDRRLWTTIVKNL